ncbi:liprin-beta-1 isoform X5 [Maniola jurtina]|uniref:liprin-beta-1 isoform X5 n=1 Tax=Maniola jurtina TaxID=191418 RepID=UPI001E686D91|nr:liprin-beta-1 isoform X5 [Maniola jurtina]
MSPAGGSSTCAVAASSPMTPSLRYHNRQEARAPAERQGQGGLPGRGPWNSHNSSPRLCSTPSLRLHGPTSPPPALFYDGCSRTTTPWHSSMKNIMNCLTPRSRRKHVEEASAPPYYPPQPPYNPEFPSENIESKASIASAWGVCYAVRYITSCEDEDNGSGRGRRSLYEGVNWMPNDAEDRVRRLEADKESLQLQVQVLSEQIAAQTEKMADLERSLHDTRQRLDDTDQRLQKEMLQRSSLETQKLELLSKLSEVRLRAAERGLVERSPPPEPAPLARPAPPRTPPANYGRQIERNTHMYSSLPRSSVLSSEARVAFGKHNMVVARGRGHSVPNLAEKDEAIPRGSPSPSLREVRSRLGSGGGVRLEGDELSRSSLRASAPRQRPQTMPWQTTDVRQWDCETTCGWLESLGLESYVGLARTWLNASPDARGLLASASHTTIEKELAIKHPLHKKKIVLALSDLLGGHGDPLLTAAGRLDTAWTLRWLEDVGVCGARAAAADAALDGRGLHRLTHTDLHTHLRVAHALHALSIRRGIQVLRDNKFNPETMIRRAPESEVVEVSIEGEQETACTPAAELARWSSHRVMQWLKEIDLAEYAPNLRGAGVHGGLMLLEPRFTAELLAALLNIPANKTLLRRHLTQRFNDLLGRDVIQQKRNAEQTLGYQPLTATTKYKVPKKSQFSLKRKKSKDDLELGELVCPLHDDCSGDLTASPMMKVKSATAGVASAVCPPRDDARTH